MIAKRARVRERERARRTYAISRSRIADFRATAHVMTTKSRPKQSGVRCPVSCGCGPVAVCDSNSHSSDLHLLLFRGKPLGDARPTAKNDFASKTRSSFGHRMSRTGALSTSATSYDVMMSSRSMVFYDNFERCRVLPWHQGTTSSAAVTCSCRESGTAEN